MHFRNVLLVPTIAVVFGIGCARIPSTEILASVRVCNEETFDDSKYEYLGIVEGKSFMTGVMANAGEGNAIATCKGEAHKLGATHIVVIQKGGLTATKVVAKAYRLKR
ncbi:MAG: hypothetical protein H6Q00_2015 [Holophagaceae bacterium]|nr:hypothetical protein [Holophagaceae bacterium]